jgi:hypothetical protein
MAPVQQPASSRLSGRDHPKRALREAAFRDDLIAVKTPTELIAEPFERFLRLPTPSPVPSL